MLEENDLNIIPFGWESNLSPLKWMLDGTEASKKIKSAPDMFVVKPENKDSYLLEIRSRNYSDQTNLWLFSSEYKKKKCNYWSEAWMVEVVPAGKVFYIQQFKNILGKEGLVYNLDKDFLPIQDILPISDDSLERWKERVLKIFKFAR